MSGSHWKKSISIQQCPPGECREVVVDDQLIALFNVDGTFYALDGVCPHQGGPLGKGALQGCVVTCPWHGWQFDVRNGQHMITPTIRQPSLACRVDAEHVWVELPGE